MSALFRRHPSEADLALFAGGELGPVARWRIESHLHGCAACRDLVGEFFELRSQVMDLGELPPMDWQALSGRIHRAVEAGRERPRALPMWRPAWSAALAMLALAAAGIYVWQQPAAPAAVLDASAGGVEVRFGDQQALTLVNAAQPETQVQWQLTADTASARYVDPQTGQITVNNVYSQ